MRGVLPSRHQNIKLSPVSICRLSVHTQSSFRLLLPSPARQKINRHFLPECACGLNTVVSPPKCCVVSFTAQPIRGLFWSTSSFFHPAGRLSGKTKGIVSKFDWNNKCWEYTEGYTAINIVYIITKIFIAYWLCFDTLEFLLTPRSPLLTRRGGEKAEKSHCSSPLSILPA